ncbi:transposase [Streptomyces hygroscopicus]|uniref:transposase n=1 Tax=Streptomyces hygroscopicus TaxID=1912 RepID=UPI001F1F72CC|nr:transposase [Streptomyces hygroscopicus]
MSEGPGRTVAQAPAGRGVLSSGGPAASGSGSYFAGSVGGAPLSTVKQYIEQQNRPL